MARIGGNPDCKGNENSGRKKVYEEHNKASAINKLWEKVNKKVQSGEELDDFEKELVKSLLPKTIKTQTDVTSGGRVIPLLSGINDIQADNSDKEAVETEEED